MAKSKTKATIGDIAARSGVSLATVSLALNHRPGVSEETRERVLGVADELGYPMKPSVSEGPCTHLATIGMVVKTDTDMSPQANPFYSKVIMGIEDACRRNGINLLFATLPVDEDNHAVQFPPLLYSDMVDGLLLVGVFIDQSIESKFGKNVAPLVLVDGYSDSECFDAVVSDNFHAAYQAVSHLIEKGHRHIGLAGSSNKCFPSILERRNGYLRALKDHNISDVYISDFNINESHGFDETSVLLQQNPQISALFCVNDDSGSAAIKAAQKLGLSVPEDISIIGYDDTYIAVNSQPTLTTMHVDTLAMGRAAVHLLSMRVDNPESARMTFTIHPWLVERESVAIPKSNL